MFFPRDFTHNSNFILFEQARHKMFSSRAQIRRAQSFSHLSQNQKSLLKRSVTLPRRWLDRFYLSARTRRERMPRASKRSAEALIRPNRPIDVSIYLIWRLALENSCVIRSKRFLNL